MRPPRLTCVIPLAAVACLGACAGNPSGSSGGGGHGGSIQGRGGSGGGSGQAGASGAAGTGGRAGAGGVPADAGATGAAGATGDGGAGATRAACAAPAAYRNLFAEILGRTQAEVDAKLSAAVTQLFHGNTTSQAIYFELGADQAFIEDIANNDVRSEGVSYGMTIAVLMNMKTEFDKLWSFAANRMRQPTGLFAWQLNTSGGIISSGDAPDGDEYFAMALLLASRKWGDSTGTNYGSEARAVMNAMATRNVFNQSPVIVRFGPSFNFTDASYVLPLFYSEWACFDTANAAVWRDATTYARTFFQAATHATTGLAPDRSNFDGSPQNNFGSDAWRVPMNIMMDLNLNAADPWQTTYAARMAAFWTQQGLASYGNGYTLSGSQTSAGHGAGLTGVNAMLAFALAPASARSFVQAAWNVAVPTGQFRYYDGCLYLLSMLHMSGKFNLGY